MSFRKRANIKNNYEIQINNGILPKISKEKYFKSIKDVIKKTKRHKKVTQGLKIDHFASSMLNFTLESKFINDLQMPKKKLRKW